MHTGKHGKRYGVSTAAALSVWLGLSACGEDGADRLDAGADNGQVSQPSTTDDAATAAVDAQSSAPTDASSAGPSAEAGPGNPGLDSGPSASVDASAPQGDAGPAAQGDGAAPTPEGGAQSDAGVPPWATRMDLGKGDGKDVITIGDSWMDYILGGGGIEAALDRAGTKYRHYGLSATTLLSGQIPRQYDSAKRANPKISTVIMTGGGNDVMFDAGSCSTKEKCEAKLKEISDALDKLWSTMAADGVKDVIYIQYSEDAGATPKENRGQGGPVPICLKGPIICHTLPTTDLVMKQLVDGIHPTSGANDRIAKALLKLMEERGIRR